MKIYTLVKTELHNQTEINHFPTLSLAQGKMCDECTEIVGEHCSLNATIDTPNWTCEVGTYYATCNNGNVIEFEIIEKDIELYDFVVNTIANRVCEIYPDCNAYYDIILAVVEDFGYDELPKMSSSEINHFIYYDFEFAIANRAADVVCADFKNNADWKEDNYQIVYDYLEGNRGYSFMARIINKQAEAINQLKEDIDNECSARGFTIFNTKKHIIAKIADRVCDRFTHVNYDVIVNSIKSLDESLVDGCLPATMDEKAIDEYIDGALFDFMANRATDVICENIKNEYTTECTINYINEHCGFITLCKVLDEDADAIDDIQIAINEENGEQVFYNKEYVYVYKGSWDGGEQFSHYDEVKVFRNHAAAYKFMEEDQEAAVNEFAKYYAKADVTLEKDKDKVLVYVNDGCILDMWEGTITKMYVQE